MRLSSQVKASGIVRHLISIDDVICGVRLASLYSEINAGCFQRSFGFLLDFGGRVRVYRTFLVFEMSLRNKKTIS